MRTLFQIPYVHLFEWSLLMLFQRAHFAGLPRQNFEDTHRVGEDVRSEILESFELLATHAPLTAAGFAVIERIANLWRGRSSVAQNLVRKPRRTLSGPRPGRLDCRNVAKIGPYH